MSETQGFVGSWTDSCEGSEHDVLAVLLGDYAEEPVVPVLTDQDLAEVADVTNDAEENPWGRIAGALLPLRDSTSASGLSGGTGNGEAGPRHVRKTEQGSDC